MRRVLLGVIAIIAVSAPFASAQDESAAALQDTNTAQAGKPSTETRQEAARPPDNVPRSVAVLTNVRLEVTITDQRAAGQPTTKTVSLVLADRSPGRLRTSGDIRTAQGYRPIVLNIDARPEFTRDGRVRTNLTLEYRPTVGEGTTEEQVLTAISESFEVILEDGKPLVVSQSADPFSDRRVRVEVKATILK